MKGKKKMLAAVLAGALTAAAALTALGAGLGGRETAVEVFEDASFDAISCRVLLEADLGSEYRTIGEKEDCLRLIYSGLKGREGEPAVSREPTEDGEKTVLSDGEVSLSFCTAEQKEEGQILQRNFLRAELFLEGAEAEEAQEAAKGLEEAAAGAGVNGCASFELEGSFAGLLTLNERQIVAEALLEQMDAGTVASVYREELCTVYAWKKGAGEGVRLPEGRVNLNLAAFCDEEQGRTVFRLGSPVLREDY